MRKYRYIPMMAALLLACAWLSGCEKEYDDPGPFVPAQMDDQVNMTIKQLKSLFTGGATVVSQDAVIKGTVVSTDRWGNNYRIFYIQDETSGIEIKIGGRNLYNEYPEGMTLYVKARNLVLGAYGGFISLGAESTEERYQNNYIDTKFRIGRSIFRGGIEEVPEGREITALSQLNDDMLGTKVTIRALVKAAGDATSTWAYDPNGDPPQSAANQTFSLGGSSIVVRTSNYAGFSLDAVPAVGSVVDITAILTKYNSTWQLILNDAKDVVEVD